MPKQQPLGVCDGCLGRIPDHLGPYTSKGKPRRYCSIQCRNTGNSREGNDKRVKKAHERIDRGQWINPATINKPDPRNIGRGVSKARKREVKEGTWRNPSLDDEAREKLSQPRKHGDNPILHSAIEKLKQGLKMKDLTKVERDEYRQYRRNLWAKRWANMSDEEKEKQRAKWRANKRKQNK